MSGKSLTSRSKQHLEALGYRVEIVEHYNYFTKRRHDLFNIFDLLAIKPGETLAVQVTSRGNMSSRRNKIADAEAIGDVREAGWRIELHGWDKYKGKYRIKVEDLS